MRNKDFVLLISSIVAFVLFVVLMQGCNTFKRAADTFDHHEKEAAGYCAEKFPIKPFTKTTTKYIKGKRDTVTLQGETVYADCSDAVTAALDDAAKKHVAVKCPPNRIVTVTDTIFTHDTTVVENTAVSEALHLELTDSKAAQDKAEIKATNRLHSALWGWGLFIGLLLAVIAYNVLKSQYAKEAKAIKTLI